MEHRRGVQPNIVALEAQHHDPVVGAGDQVAVCQAYALGLSARAAGIENLRDIGWRTVAGSERLGACRQAFVSIVGAQRILFRPHDRVGTGRQLSGKRVAGERQHGFRLGVDARDLARGQARVERHENRSERGDGIVDFERTQTVAIEQQHAIAGRDALAQPRDETAHALTEPAVGQRRRPVGHGKAAGIQFGCAREHAREMKHRLLCRLSRDG